MIFTLLVGVTWAAGPNLSLNKVLAKSLPSLQIQLETGPTNHYKKIDDWFELKAKESWRPDNVNKPASTEIGSYKTNAKTLINTCAENLEKMLVEADNSVSEIKVSHFSTVRRYKFKNMFRQA